MEGEVAPASAWSFARHHTLQECPRRYWFEYLARTSPEADAKLREALPRLRALVPLGYLRGALVHDEIGKLMPSLLAGKRADLGAAVREVEAWVDEDEKDPLEHIAEFHNGAPVDHGYFAAVRNEAGAELHTFIDKVWPTYAAYEHIEHERLERFEVGGTPAAVILDYCGRTPEGGLAIADWKTGREDPTGESKLQLGGYGLWAVARLGAKPAAMELRLVYLGSGVTKAWKPTKAELDKAARTTRDDWARMSAGGKKAAFEARPERARCLSCKFARVCEEAEIRH